MTMRVIIAGKNDTRQKCAHQMIA